MDDIELSELEYLVSMIDSMLILNNQNKSISEEIFLLKDCLQCILACMETEEFYHKGDLSRTNVMDIKKELETILKEIEVKK